MVTKQQLDDCIDKLSTDLTAKLKSMLEESISNIKDNIIENLKISNEKLQIRVGLLENNVKNLENEKIEKEKEIQATLQHSRLNQIIISGIPEDIQQSKLEETLIQILNKIKVYKIGTRDIEACHRLGNKDAIVKFVNRKDAEDCLVNRKNLRQLDNSEVGIGSNSKIFVSENLSPYMSKLAYYCRVLKRKSLLTAIRTYRGIIKVGLKNDSDILCWHKIGHTNDLIKLFGNPDNLLN